MTLIEFADLVSDMMDRQKRHRDLRRKEVFDSRIHDEVKAAESAVREALAEIRQQFRQPNLFG